MRETRYRLGQSGASLICLGSSDQQTLVEALDSYDVVVDCTTSDDAGRLLAEVCWPIPRTFASFSVGYGGRRLFAFGVIAHQFPATEFRDVLTPWKSR